MTGKRVIKMIKRVEFEKTVTDAFDFTLKASSMLKFACV